jgi:hypothetical protein
MNEHSDSWDEMHDDSLSPEETERLISGTSDRPELADLASLMASVRALPKAADTPAVSAALSEFVGVDLTPTPEHVVLLDAEVLELTDVSTSQQAEPVRRNTMIGQLAAFVGTFGGKVAVCTTVAAASVGGAHVTGAVDVPFLPDNDPVELETVDLPEDPDALAFVDDEVDEVDDIEKPEIDELEKDDVEKSDEEENNDNKDSESGDSDEVESKDEKEFFDPYPDHELDEEKAEEPKAEPKKEEPKAEPKKEELKEEAGDKTEAQEAAEALIGALEEEVHAAKDAVRAEATALINPLEEERDGLLEQLEAAHLAIDEEWEGVIASLIADLEGTEGEAERAAIEEQIGAAEEAWVAARVAAELEVDPRLSEINELFEVIETERDAEIDRLLNEFREAVEEIRNSL